MAALDSVSFLKRRCLLGSGFAPQARDPAIATKRTQGEGRKGQINIGKIQSQVRIGHRDPQNDWQAAEPKHAERHGKRRPRARLEQELRANLLKRKAQAKARAKDVPEKDRDEGRQS